MKECEKKGLLWCSHQKATEYTPGMSDCITYKFGEDKGLGHGDAVFYENKGYQIINYKELVNKTCEFSFKEITKIITNGEATIVFWNDNTKTIVKRGKGQKNSQELAILYAYFQKHSGLSKTKSNKVIQDLINNIYVQG